MKLERVCLNAVQWERIKSFGPGSELGLLIERHGLFVAIRLNSLQLLKALLSGGASTNDNYKGITPLVLASAIASAALVEILLAFGVDIEAPTDSVQKGIFPGACTALIAATIKGREDVVQVLLQHGAVVDTKDTLGWTALAHACARSHLGVDVVKILLARGADPFAKTAQLCTFAAVKFDKGSNPVMIASALGHQAALAALLRRGAGMDRGRRLDARTRGGRTALLLASRHGRLPAVRALLAAGADADAAAAADAAESALTAAVFHRHRAVVAALLAAGADPHRPVDGETPVMWAARQGNAEALDLLLKAGATPAGRNPEGATALHLAVGVTHASCGQPGSAAL